MQNPAQNQQSGYLQNMTGAAPQQNMQNNGQGYLQGVDISTGQPNNSSPPGGINWQSNSSQQPQQINQNDPREVWSAINQELQQVSSAQGPAAAEHMYQMIVKPNFEKKYGQSLPQTFSGIPPQALPQNPMQQTQSAQNNYMQQPMVNNQQQLQAQGQMNPAQPMYAQPSQMAQQDPQANSGSNVGTILSMNQNSSKQTSDQARRKAQGTISQYADLSRQFDRLVDTMDYKDFNLKNRTAYKIDVIKDFMGNSDPDEQRRITRWRSTASNAQNIFFAWVQSQSGAQVSDQEMKRRQDAYLNTDLSPTQAKAETERLYKETNVNMIAQQVLASKGVAGNTQAFKKGFTSVQNQAQEDVNKFLKSFQKSNPQASAIQGIKLWRYLRTQDGTYL